MVRCKRASGTLTILMLVGSMIGCTRQDQPTSTGEEGPHEVRRGKGLEICSGAAAAESQAVHLSVLPALLLSIRN